MTDKEAIDNLKNYIECLMEDYGYYKDIVEFRDSVEHLEKSLQTQQAEIEKKDKMIDKIQKEVRDHIGFENRLKRDNKEPDLFNQGRFYVANNINNILKGKVENGN